jgi:sulfofructose kinase
VQKRGTSTIAVHVGTIPVRPLKSYSDKLKRSLKNAGFNVRMPNIRNFKMRSFQKRKDWTGFIKNVTQKIDVLCVGVSSYDLVFTVSHHPLSDEKCTAKSLLSCGGGPAANAAVTVARLGGKSAFSGYLGTDFYGEQHLKELQSENVMTDLIVRGSNPTPLSVVLVKPNGNRALINYRSDKQFLKKESVDFSRIQPKVVLFDGHEPELSIPLARRARSNKTYTILDAGSVHHGTKALMREVDYLVCSEKFAKDFTEETDVKNALNQLHHHCSNVVVTLGERGLIWKRDTDQGRLAAFKIKSVDTTGAGDAFHGAFAFCVASHKNWEEILNFSSAAAALCCTKMGGRNGIPTRKAVETFLGDRIKVSLPE